MRSLCRFARITPRMSPRLPMHFNQTRQMTDDPMDADIAEEYTVKALTYDLETYQRISAERTVPWFLKNLPKQYFSEIDRELQKDHLRALTALAEAGLASYEEEEAVKLCEYAAKGNLRGLKTLVANGAHPNVGDYDGRTAIHLAASEGNIDVLKYLHTVRGFNINVVDRFGGTPLKDAIRQGHDDVARWIRSKGGAEEMPAEAVWDRKVKPRNEGMVELQIKSRTHRYTSFFVPTHKGDTGVFTKCINQLPLDKALIRVKAFTTKDHSLGLNVFEFDVDELHEDVDPSDLDEKATDVFALAKRLENGEDIPGLTWDECFREDSLRNLLRGTTQTYLRNTKAGSVLRHLEGVNKVVGSDSCVATARVCPDSERSREENWYWVTSIASSVHAYSEIQRLSNYLGSKGLCIDRFHMDIIKDPTDNSDKCVLRALVDREKELSAEEMEMIEREVPRLKYLDDRVLNWTAQNSKISMEDAEVATALSNMIFPVLNKEHPHMYSLDRIHMLLMDLENVNTAIAVAQLWQAKFNPDNAIDEADYIRERADIESEIRNKGEAAQNLLRKMLEATDNSLRTNFFLPKRRSIAIRIESELMMVDKEAPVPFGVFFAHSRSLNGFQVRFRDIARGGLRIVPTMGFERFSQESMRHFDETYGLAFAQQLKNKDIPEGGSKAVCMVNVSDRTPNSQDFLVRKSVKSFTDGLLDLITPDPEIKSRIVDYYGEDELLYLGPDENITPQDINWVIERAAKRGMKYPSAFMSSKPDAGINHKVYGVTSEGVAVFLKVALKEHGYDTENDTFTVKITGGPNGDVAGNMINILYRDYPGRAKIVGMCDHTGGVENESGLDMEELLRLFKADLPISGYDESKVGDGGQKYGVSTPEEIQLRNTLHNRLKANAFIPAGGRPNTININNYDKYFLPDGTPSAPLIVEAANIFTTPEARAEFAKRGISIVKDSSANKAGVCCSSYEIVSSMLLSKDEFMAVKEELVNDVLSKLRESARVEAELLFREYRLNPALPMVHYSQAISGAINRATDAVVDALKRDYSLIDDVTRRRLLVDSLPAKLVEVAGDRLEDLPKMYMISMMGAKLGSRMVYNEGLDFIDSMNDAGLASLATKYLHYNDSMRDLMTQVTNSDIEDKENLLKVLKSAGVRSVINSGI